MNAPVNPKWALIIALANLARAAPSEWDMFLQEYRRHYARAIDAFIAAAHEQTSIQQGRARECREFYDICATCREEAEKLGKANAG